MRRNCERAGRANPRDDRQLHRNKRAYLARVSKFETVQEPLCPSLPDLGLCSRPQSRDVQLHADQPHTGTSRSPPHSQAKSSTSFLPSPIPTLPFPGDWHLHSPALSGPGTSAPVLCSYVFPSPRPVKLLSAQPCQCQVPWFMPLLHSLGYFIAS